MLLERLALLGLERVEDVGGAQLVDRLGVHVSPSTAASSSRSRARPANIRLLIVPSGSPEPLRELRLREPAVVGELDRLALLVGELAERRLYALALEAQPGCVGGRRPARVRLDLGQRLGAAPLLAAHEVDRAPVDERHDPRARLRALGQVLRGAAPDREERLLHRVLRQRLVAQHPQREAVGGPPVAVVELRQRDLVRPRDERDDCFVRKVCQVATRHGPAPYRAPLGPYHQEGRIHVDLDSPAAAGRFDRISSYEPPHPRAAPRHGAQPRPLGRRRPREGRSHGGAARDRLLQRAIASRQLQRRRARATSPRPATTRSRTTTCSRSALGKATPSGLRFRYPNGAFPPAPAIGDPRPGARDRLPRHLHGRRRGLQEQRLKASRARSPRRESRHLGVMTNIAAGRDRPGAGLPARLHRSAGARRAQAVPGLTTSVACIPSCRWFAMLHQSW